MRTTGQSFAPIGVLIRSAIIFAFTLLAFQRSSQAQIDRSVEFKIESQAFIDDLAKVDATKISGGSAKPISETKTLFRNGLIFDFPIKKKSTHAPPSVDAATVKSPSGPNEILIYDSHQQAIHLLDMQRQVQLKLVGIRLNNIVNTVRKQTAEDNRTKFMVEENFTETIDADRLTIKLAGDNSTTYWMNGFVPADPRILPAYFEFLDVFTKVQVTDPRRIPPFARLRLNQSIRKVGWMPSRVEIKMSGNGFLKEPFAAHTKHQLTMDLTAGDLSEIEFATKAWSRFPRVSLAKYRNLPEQDSLLKRLRSKKTPGSDEASGSDQNSDSDKNEPQ